MKFALVNGYRTEAQPALKGSCSHCQGDAIAKCGIVKIWHWAHKSKASCDPWWEGETEWHREWKNCFPTDWQEKGHIDAATGEKHIADIKTDKEFVIEFQHSAIKSSEIQSREAFYQNMVWVVDGTRLKSDYPRFCKGFRSLRPVLKSAFCSASPEECLPESWLTSKVPVYFDFQGIAPPDHPDEMRVRLWCLLPGRLNGYAVVTWVWRKQFIELSATAPQILPTQDVLLRIAQLIQL